MVGRVIWSVVVFLVTWLVLWILAEILKGIPTDPTVWVGNVLSNLAVLLGLLAGILYFWRGETWFHRI